RSDRAFGHPGSAEQPACVLVGSRGRWGMRDWGIGRAGGPARCGRDDTVRRRRERDLAAYDDGAVPERIRRELASERVARRAAVVEPLRAEGCRSVVEVGAGPGRDATAFAAAGPGCAG